MNETEFWNRVNELLDERADPLEDRGIQQCVRSSPSRLEALERLLGRVHKVEQLPGQPVLRSSWRKVAAVAAVLVGLLSLLPFLRNQNEVQPADDSLSSVQPTEAESPLRLYQFRLTVRDEGPRGSREIVVEDGRIARTHSLFDANPRTDQTRITVESSRRRLP